MTDTVRFVLYSLWFTHMYVHILHSPIITNFCWNWWFHKNTNANWSFMLRISGVSSNSLSVHMTRCYCQSCFVVVDFSCVTHKQQLYCLVELYWCYWCIIHTLNRFSEFAIMHNAIVRITALAHPHLSSLTLQYIAICLRAFYGLFPNNHN